jgi:hypothetical protein
MTTKRKIETLGLLLTTAAAALCAAVGWLFWSKGG